MRENFANSTEYSNPFASLIGFVVTMLMKIGSNYRESVIQFKIRRTKERALFTISYQYHLSRLPFVTFRQFTADAKRLLIDSSQTSIFDWIICVSRLRIRKFHQKMNVRNALYAGIKFVFAMFPWMNRKFCILWNQFRAWGRVICRE